MAKTPGSGDATPAAAEPETPASATAKKGHATPTRKEREAANKRPIVVADRKEAKARSKEQERAERQRAQAGYAAGDERYLPVRDRGPQKKWVRDYVDARLSAGELVIPIMFLVIVLMYLPFQATQLYSTFALLAFFGFVVLDSVFLAWRVQKRVNERWGDRAERVRAYAVTRGLQMRMMRMPKPQVKRFRFPD